MNSETNEIAQNIEQVEVGMDQAKKGLKLAEALDRLHRNKDFKEVILKGFLEDESTRAVLLKSDPNCQTEQEQKEIDRVIISIGGLFCYFRTVFALGERYAQSLQDDEETREELLKEQLGEDEV